MGSQNPRAKWRFGKGSTGLLGGAFAGHCYSWGEWGFFVFWRQELGIPGAAAAHAAPMVLTLGPVCGQWP